MEEDRIVLEWTEINGKKFPKKVIDIVDKKDIPRISKNNGEILDEIFKSGNI